MAVCHDEAGLFKNSEYFMRVSVNVLAVLGVLFFVVGLLPIFINVSPGDASTMSVPVFCSIITLICGGLALLLLSGIQMLNQKVSRILEQLKK
jgi:hypothetical protein